MAYAERDTCNGHGRRPTEPIVAPGAAPRTFLVSGWSRRLVPRGLRDGCPLIRGRPPTAGARPGLLPTFPDHIGPAPLAGGGHRRGGYLFGAAILAPLQSFATLTDLVGERSAVWAAS
ncbi:hypothetical protein ADK64_37690 [Streptomyces sp. MMG1121]|nr:hypothetical protein ADK64_37690 [Streptomyces sp. MMG1121]